MRLLVVVALLVALSGAQDGENKPGAFADLNEKSLEKMKEEVTDTKTEEVKEVHEAEEEGVMEGKEEAEKEEEKEKEEEEEEEEEEENLFHSGDYIPGPKVNPACFRRSI